MPHKDGSDSSFCMPRSRNANIEENLHLDLTKLSREEVEAWGLRGWKTAHTLDNQLNQDSTNSSRPPSSDNPYKRAVRRGNKADGEASPVSGAEV